MEVKSHENWQDEIRTAFRDPLELAHHLGLPLDQLPPLPKNSDFPLLVPRGFADRMTKGDPCDPLLLQVWPHAAESNLEPFELADPVGDLKASLVPGLLQKYAQRALLVTSGACAVHCRYCFRQHFPYHDASPSQIHWQAQLDHLRQDLSLREVVLSGGDPLSLPDSVLASRIQELEGIAQLSTLRIHTRLPVVIPSRVTSDLRQILSESRFRIAVVIHANHPSEITPSVADALTKLHHASATVLNQSVLLAGVNDDADVLEQLSQALWQAGALPYYLHALDRVRGSARFAVPDQEAIRLVEILRSRLPGYLVPRLVREIEGARSKMPVG